MEERRCLDRTGVKWRCSAVQWKTGDGKLGRRNCTFVYFSILEDTLVNISVVLMVV